VPPKSTQSHIVPDPFETPILTIPEAGQLLGLGRHASYNAARNGQIPTRQLGRKLVVPTAELLALIGLWDSDSTRDAEAQPSRAAARHVDTPPVAATTAPFVKRPIRQIRTGRGRT
jgi:hypothetical protein